MELLTTGQERRVIYALAVGAGFRVAPPGKPERYLRNKSWPWVQKLIRREEKLKKWIFDTVHLVMIVETEEEARLLINEYRAVKGHTGLSLNLSNLFRALHDPRIPGQVKAALISRYHGITWTD